MIDITLIGTSALMPLPDRALTAALLSCAGHRILFDCGEGTQTAARKAGANAFGADIIALTHYHGDHIFGLPGLLQTMSCVMGRTEPLTIVGPPGLEAELSPILKLAGWLPYQLTLMELPPEGIRLADLHPGWPELARLSAFKTEHRVSSQGYCFTLGRAGKFNPQQARALDIPTPLWGRLQRGETLELDDRTLTPDMVTGEPRKGLKFVFTGDTAACPSLIEAAADADLLISEATYGEDDQAQLAVDHGHMNFAQAADAAARAGAKRLWLTHFSQMVTDPEACLENARARFPGAVCGADGMSITLKFEE